MAATGEEWRGPGDESALEAVERPGRLLRAVRTPWGWVGAVGAGQRHRSRGPRGLFGQPRPGDRESRSALAPAARLRELSRAPRAARDAEGSRSSSLTWSGISGRLWVQGGSWKGVLASRAVLCGSGPGSCSLWALISGYLVVSLQDSAWRLCGKFGFSVKRRPPSSPVQISGYKRSLWNQPGCESLFYHSLCDLGEVT